MVQGSRFVPAVSYGLKLTAAYFLELSSRVIHLFCSNTLLLLLVLQVPAHVYDRSLFVFGTAFLLDVLGLLFELKTSRMDVVLLPAFVKGAATLTNALVRSGWGTVAFSTGGRV